MTGYNSTFNVEKTNNKLYFKKTITNENDLIQITIPPGAYELESVNDEFKRIIIDKGYYTEDEYLFMIKPNVSTLCGIIEISPQKPLISFVFDDIFRNLLGFIETVLYKEYNISTKPVVILSFDNIFLECDFAKGMIYEEKRSGINHKWTMTVIRDRFPGINTSNHLQEVLLGIRWKLKMLFQVFLLYLKLKITNCYHSTVKVSLADYQSKKFN